MHPRGSRFVVLLLLTGCSVLQPAAVVPDAGSDSSLAPVPATDQLDLLVVFDNGGYGWQTASHLQRHLSRVVEILATGDREGDGLRDFEPVRSLHLGVVTADVGAGAVIDARCRPRGDDGVLRTAVTYPFRCDVDDFLPAFPDRVFSYDRAGALSAAEVGLDAACVLYDPALDTRGCYIQSPLEAALRATALSPRPDGSSPVTWTAAGYRPPTFPDGTSGHGDDPGTNGAFLRPDSVLAIWIVSAKDDCASPNPRLFSDDAEFASVPTGLRCLSFRDQLYPTDRYVRGVLGLRASPSRLVYAVWAGVPEAVSGSTPTAILAHPDMELGIDAHGSDIRDGCNGPGNYAAPAVRMTTVARDILGAGGRASVHSICSGDDQPATDAFLDEVILALAGTP